MTGPWRLIADIGGTNARFACANQNGEIGNSWVRPVSEFASFSDALSSYIDTCTSVRSFSSAIIAGAGPVIDGKIRLTNSPWQIVMGDLRTSLGPGVAVRIVNDLEAIAHSLPYLTEEQVEFIDILPGPPQDRKRMIVVNVGTGFGSSTLIRTGSGWTSCPSESGHMSLGATTPEDFEVIRSLRLSHVSVEDILSGGGVRRLASVDGIIDGHQGTPIGEDDDFDLLVDTASAGRVIEIFTRFLAQTSANLVLASASWDAIFICGSVATAWWQRADLGAFRRIFASHSRMGEQLAQTPIGLIKAKYPAFIGLTHVDFAEYS
ncbi:MAG: ROK family protein [Hyphomicrobiaceae bacterium]